MRIRSAILMASLLGAGAVRAASTPSAALLVLAKSDRTLSIVDPSNLKVIARMPSGPDPHEVIASADGKFAYISNYGGGAYNTLTVVDLVGQKTAGTVDLGALRGPHGLMYAGGKVWFTAEAAKAIGSYDPETKKIDLILGTGQNRTHMIYVFEELTRIVTSNISSATMTMIEKGAVGGAPGPGPGAGRGPGGPPGRPRPEDWNETVIPVGRGAEGFDVSPDAKELWAANAQDGTVSVIDIAAKKVVKTLDANVRGANRLKFTPDGKLALISTLSGPDVVVFDTASRNEVKRVKVGRGAAGIQMQPDGARVFVACTPDDYVAIMDLKTLAVTGHLDAGKQPDGMAWAVHP
ncbi:MAG: YncE family protein [Acidobacteriota bacterium]|nr:YncE family protein [Acidobacteriota bacterium]